MLREKARGTVSPKSAKPQKAVTSRVEEKSGQKKRPSVNLGQRKDNISKGEASSKVRRTSREVRGSQTEGKEGSLHESDRDLNYGKATRDVLISVVSNIGGEEGDSSGGEKPLNPLLEGGYGRFNFELGREIKACRNPNFREERSLAPKYEDEGDDISQADRTVCSVAECLGKVAGTWPMPLCTAWRCLPAHQEKEGIGSGQVSFMDCGSASGEGSDLVVDRAQGRELGLGRPNRSNPGPTPNFTSSLLELGSCGPTYSEAVEKGDGLCKEVQLRSSLQPNNKRSCLEGIEENVIHNWETGENREDHSLENESLKINRYDDNLYVQSTSALSVFGRPLLSGDISGLGGINGEEDLEPLRVVAADGREWGVDISGALIEEGEGLEAVDHRTNEAQNEASELLNYESWEKSCLAKFSDFLGFPTKGFENEITKLLRNLVNAQKLGKGKECLTMSKSERELRKLKRTINYNGNNTSREGGRDRGNLLLKLK